MRLRLLCEDTTTENLVHRLCDALGISWWRDVRVEVAPDARGAASGWVLARYAIKVEEYRASANAQPDLGLLVMIDGDNEGVVQRTHALESKLAQYETKRGRALPRATNERIALFVPTWSVETWLSWLEGDSQVVESRSYKDSYKRRFRGSRRT